MKKVLHLKAFLTVSFLLFCSTSYIFADITKTVGATGSDFTTLKLAFDAINTNAGSAYNGVVTIQIKDNTTETATATLNASAGYTSVVIYPIVSGKTITGSIAGAPIINLNGAESVTIDGRLNATGSTPDLTISNTSTSNTAGTSTIRFINGTVNSTIQYTNILGAETNSTSGVVFFSTSTGGQGNNNNTISYNNISSTTAANRPLNAIFSSGTAGKLNTGINISNNNIYNFINLASASSAINLSSNTTACSIIGNSIYETTSLVTTAAVTYNLIYLNNATGTGFVVTGNTIGGSVSGNTGVFTKSGNNNNCYAISVNVGTGTVTCIQNNTIKNISWTNSGAATFAGIYITAGSVNVGTDQGNIIGAPSGNGCISVSGGATNANVYGVYVTSSGMVDCRNNTIASITTNNVGTASTNFYGIYKNSSAGNMYIINNVIGDDNTSSSINAGSASTSTGQYVYGIYSSGTATVNVTDNKISNLINSSTNPNFGVVNGIVSTAGTNTISNNTIHDLTAMNANVGTTSGASVMGISISGSTTQRTVSGNTIYNLSSTYSGSASVVVTGLYFSAGTASNTVSQNFIYNLSNLSTGALASIFGIRIAAGTTTYSNNVISLGGNTATTLYGMYETGATGTTNSMYYNTIYLFGSLASGATPKSYALYSASNNNVRNIKNNILVNARSTVSGANLHYPLYVSSTGGTYSIDYNDYFSTGTGSVFAYFGSARTSLSALQTATGQNSNSVSINPAFANAGGTVANNYLPSSVILLGTTGTGVGSDYTGAGRLATPTMGAFEIGTLLTNVDVYKSGVLQAGYNTLRGAFSAINAGTHTGSLELRLNASTSEAAAAILNASGTGSANYTSVLVYPTVSGLSILGNVATPLIDLSGADNVTIDGRVGATGTTPDLTISNANNSSTAGTSTIRFINDASNNAIQYCNILGSETNTSSGVVFFSTTTGTTGNDGNVIDNNNISASSNANRPINAIYSSGTAAKENSGIVISNNKIYDCFNKGVASNGIYLTSNTTASTISNNSIYETSLFIPTASVAYNAIYINNTSGSGFTVTGNVIGGSSSINDGTFTKSGMNNTFVAININVGTTATSSLQNNTVQNFSWTNSSSANWTGINVSAGNVNVGTVSGNVIGTASGTSSVIFTAAATGANIYGINISSTGTVDCRNNTVAAITSANTPTLATNIYAINKTATAGTVTISNNTVGSNTDANSIYASSTSTANSQNVYGIYSQCTGTAAINSNLVANLNNGSTNTTAGTAGTVTGIASATATLTMSNNIVHDLTNSNAYTSSGSTGSVIGIMLSGTTALKTVTGNNVYDLSNTYTAFAGYVTGIFFAGSTGGNAISRNFVSGLSVHNASVGAIIIGMRISTGLSTYSNNIISVTGNTASTIYGIVDAGSASQNTNLYYNTVYVGGSPSSGTYNSYALFNTSSAATRDYRNNIFYNARSNSGGASGKHYSVSLPSGGTLTADYNDYFVSGTGSKFGYFGAADVLTLAAWKTTTSKDANSYNVNPSFVNEGTLTASDYYPNAVDLIATTGLGVNSDYNLVARATVPYIGAWEAIVNKWKGSVSNDYSNPANWTANVVPPSNSNIYFNDNPLNDCYLSADLVVNDFKNSQSNYLLHLNGYKMTLKGSLTLNNGAKIDAAAPNSTFELAGTSAQTIPANTFDNNQVYNLTVSNANNVTFSGTINLLNTLAVTAAGKLDGVTNSPTLTFGGSNPQGINNGLILNNRLANLTIDNADVTLNTDFTVNNVLTINNGKKLTVPTSTFLNVVGTISNAAGTTGLVLKADPTGAAPNASLVFHNAYGSPVQASVEMYSKSANGKSQYIGIPLRNLNFQDNFTGYSIKQYNEAVVGTSGMWASLGASSTLSSFLGYALVRSSSGMFTFQGTLENSDFNAAHTPLTYTSTATYAGHHLISNPYTAAVDISQIVFGSGDPAVIENSIYFYNTGSYRDWVNAGSGGVSGGAPGQYLTVPVFVAGIGGLPSQIPSMSAVVIMSKSSNPNAWIEMPYSAVVSKNSELMRAKNSANKVCTRIEIAGSKSLDCMWIILDSVCTHSFDNGWDGYKSIAAAGTLQLFATEFDGKNYQVNSVNDINNIELSLQASLKDTSYTMVFNHQNLSDVHPTLFLVDQLLGKTIDVSLTGTKYTFTSYQTSSPSKRFKLITSYSGGKIATSDYENASSQIRLYGMNNVISIDNSSELSGYVSLYDLSGQFIQQIPFASNQMTNVNVNLPAGPYLAKVITNDKKEFDTRFLLK